MAGFAYYMSRMDLDARRSNQYIGVFQERLNPTLQAPI
jgi:hypothetical protein